MTTMIALPLSDEAAKACVIAADRLGVEPWELAVHALWWRENYDTFLRRPPVNAQHKGEDA